jgi:stress-induced morphogen
MPEGDMAMDSAAIGDLIRQGIPGAEVRISDLRGDGEHYSAFIVAESFRGKTRIQQHQMVYAALQGKMGTELHALAIQTAVPE